jgi:hypothetical protein
MSERKNIFLEGWYDKSIIAARIVKRSVYVKGLRIYYTFETVSLNTFFPITKNTRLFRAIVGFRQDGVRLLVARSRGEI